VQERKRERERDREAEGKSKGAEGREGKKERERERGRDCMKVEWAKSREHVQGQRGRMQRAKMSAHNLQSQRNLHF